MQETGTRHASPINYYSPSSFKTSSVLISGLLIACAGDRHTARLPH
nr:MAG TPA: hypothetical protein [Caudoviricetes sp.]